MALMNTNSKYGSLAKWLHWIIAILIIVMLVVGFFMGDLPKETGLQGFTYNAHKITGLIILLLVCIRFIWTLINVKPDLPGTPSFLEKFAERSVHWLFYLVMFAMPLSGWIMATAAGYNPHMFGIHFAMPFIHKSKSLSDFAESTHEIIAWVIIVLLVLHIAAALFHHIVKKDDVLKRMRPCGK